MIKLIVYQKELISLKIVEPKKIAIFLIDTNTALLKNAKHERW
jgi:hypothetical protein